MEAHPGIKFESTLPWKEEKTETLVIHCSDHRYQNFFDEFISEGLGIISPARLVLPGGPQILIAGAHLPKFEWAMRQWMKFFTKGYGLKDVICIGHLDCAWYKNISIGNVPILQLKERQISDLKQIRVALQDMSSKIRVRLFYAEPDDKKKVEFWEIH
jgi:hypothetical protein